MHTYIYGLGAHLLYCPLQYRRVQALHRGLPRHADGGVAVAGLGELIEELRKRKRRMPTAQEWERCDQL